METMPDRRYGEIREGRVVWIFYGAQLPEYNAAMTVVDLTDHPQVDEGWIVDGMSFVPPTDRPRVPDSITMRQARRCLRLHGLLDAVQPAIDSLPEPDRTDAQIDWDFSAAVERDRGFVLQVAQALGLSDQQLDDLFIEAATL